MEKEKLDFIEQFLNELEGYVNELEKAKKENDPKQFNEIKKKSYHVNEEIKKLIG